MGYFIKSLPSNDDAKIKKENIDSAFMAAKMLNKLQLEPIGSIWTIKHGGAVPSDREKPEDSKSVGNPNISFRWVPWNYDELCKDIFEVFQVFGFITKVNDRGDITKIFYPLEKTGDESALLVALAPYMEKHEMDFEGEDGALWSYDFDSKYPAGCEIHYKNDLADVGNVISGHVLLKDLVNSGFTIADVVDLERELQKSKKENEILTKLKEVLEKRNKILDEMEEVLTELKKLTEEINERKQSELKQDDEIRIVELLEQLIKIKAERYNSLKNEDSSLKREENELRADFEKLQ